jgi:hypothetical protein
MTALTADEDTPDHTLASQNDLICALRPEAARGLHSRADRISRASNPYRPGLSTGPVQVPQRMG